MSCCHHYELIEGNESAFSVDASRVTFGPGSIRELGSRAARYPGRRVAVFTDSRIRRLAFFDAALRALELEGLDVAVFDEVGVEPTDASLAAAIQFAGETRADTYVSVGGGSVIDTCKAANLYTSWPAPLLDYVNQPVGNGNPIPGELHPHIACPTTCGTGSECTGIAIFDFPQLGAKTGIAARQLRPTEALIDPAALASLPATVLACSAFDVLSHAAESYTARPYTHRAAGAGAARPLSQGANPWSDMGCQRALELLGRYFVRALNDSADTEAREALMWAATLAGIAFGNAGVHAPHGMSYAVAGLVRNFNPPDYPDDHVMVPHGMSVIVNAPAVFRATAQTVPERHLQIAGWLGAEVRGAAVDDAGEVLAGKLLDLMTQAKFPLGLKGLGYSHADLGRLTGGAWPQQRLLNNTPCDVSEGLLTQWFDDAMDYAA